MDAGVRRGLLVDRRPGHEGCYVMPEGGDPVGLVTFWQADDGIFYATVTTGETLPVIEVRTQDWRTFKQDC